MRRPSQLVPLLTLAASLPVAVLPVASLAETVSTPADRSGLTLTIYDSNMGLVRDHRRISLPKGDEELVVEGIAGQALPGSASLAAEHVAVRDHGFDLDGISAANLLAASVGREVTVVWKGAESAPERARVLAVGSQPVFQVGDRIVVAEPERILFDALPVGVRLGPVWRASVVVGKAGRHEADFSYATGGLDWHAQYDGVLDGDTLVLSAWASVSNASGVDFPDAAVKVVAGNVNRVAVRGPVMKAAGMEMAAPVAAMAPMDSATREAAGAYHLYSIPGKVSLRRGETRQVALMSPVKIKVERRFELPPVPPHAWRARWNGNGVQHPVERLEFTNTLGQPLPAGMLRVTGHSQGGAPLLLGEDRLPATPEGASATLTLGESFDLTAKRVQTDFQRIAKDVTEAAWEVRLANGSPRSATVVVRERFYNDWLVVDESAPHDKEDSAIAAWTVKVPAKGEAVLKYHVRVQQ